MIHEEHHHGEGCSHDHGHDHCGHGHEHHHGHGHAAHPFNHTELSAMRTDDRAAARNIVLLMVGIFIMGLAGYIAVGFWVVNS